MNKNLAQLVAEFVFETTYLHFFSLNRFGKEDFKQFKKKLLQPVRVKF